MDFAGALGSVTVLQLVIARVRVGQAESMYWRMSERPWFGFAAAACIYGAWLLFARVYFGTFWPLMLSSGFVVSPSPDLRVPNLERQIVLLVSGEGVLAVALIVALVFGWRRLWERRADPNLLVQPLLPWLWIVLLPTLYVMRGVPAAEARSAPPTAGLCEKATGERAMSTPGPSRKLTLRARASRPRPSPSWRAKARSQGAASATPPEVPMASGRKRCRRFRARFFAGSRTDARSSRGNSSGKTRRRRSTG